MGLLVVNKTYEDGEVLGEVNLDNAFDSIEAFVNGQNISAENIQDNSITASELQTNSVTTAKISNNAVSTAKIADNAVTLAKLAVDLAAFLVPTGRVSAFAGDSAPTGWLLCSGTAVSRTTYSALFSLVGVRFGSGDGTTTFNLPDLRGRFIRGKDSGTGRDPEAADRTAMATGGAVGDNIGSVQLDDFKWTELGINTGAVAGPGGAFSAGFTPNVTLSVTNADGDKSGLETRPKNAYMNFIIKT